MDLTLAQRIWGPFFLCVIQYRFPGTVLDFFVPGVPGKGSNVPDFKGFKFNFLFTKMVTKMPKIDVLQASFV